MIVPFLLIYFTSCQNTSSEIGGNYFQSHSSLTTVDTVTIKLETVYLDSIASSNTGILLVGSHTDTLTGRQQCTAYFQLGAPSIKSISQPVGLDSICLVLKPNGYYSGDTTQGFSLAAHILDQIPVPGSTGTFSNNASVAYQSKPLAVWSGKISPNFTDSLTIRLPDSLGQSWINALSSNQTNLQDDNSFINNYLKGLALTSPSSLIYGFRGASSSAFIRIYYHTTYDSRTPLYIDCSLTNPGNQFNQLDLDRSGTVFSSLGSSNKILNSSQTHQVSVLEPMADMAIRMEFPYLSNLSLLGSYSRVLTALLTVQPQIQSYSPANPLPPLVSICESQGYYSILDSLVDPSGLIQHGNLIQDFAFGNSSYTYDITPYITTQIANTNFSNRSQLMLMLPVPAFNGTLQRLVVNDPSLGVRGLKLSLQIILYNN